VRPAGLSRNGCLMVTGELYRGRPVWRTATIIPEGSFREASQVTLKIVVREVACIDAEDARASQAAAGHEAVQFKALQRRLVTIERGFEDSGQFPGVALLEQAQREKHARARLSPERARSTDQHSCSYDHNYRSNVKIPQTALPPPLPAPYSA